MDSKEVEDESSEDGEIGPGVFDPGAHLIVVHGDIQTPVQRILNLPMGADGAHQQIGVRGDTADIQALLPAGLTIHGSF